MTPFKDNEDLSTVRMLLESIASQEILGIDTVDEEKDLRNLSREEVNILINEKLTTKQARKYFYELTLLQSDLVELLVNNGRIYTFLNRFIALYHFGMRAHDREVKYRDILKENDLLKKKSDEIIKNQTKFYNFALNTGIEALRELTSEYILSTYVIMAIGEVWDIERLVISADYRIELYEDLMQYPRMKPLEIKTFRFNNRKQYIRYKIYNDIKKELMDLETAVSKGYSYYSRFSFYEELVEYKREYEREVIDE